MRSKARFPSASATPCRSRSSRRPRATSPARRARSSTTSTAARQLPTFVPPRPFERGYRGRPTLIQNPETLAQLALVARFGVALVPRARHGRRSRLGAGHDHRCGQGPGVYELAFGTTMSDLLAAAGGPTEPLQALLVGGYFGTWVEAVAGDLASARARGPSVGRVHARVRRADRARRELMRPARERARDRRTSPGSPPASAVRACTGCGRSPMPSARSPPASPARSDRDRVLRWAAEVRGRGACHHPDGAARFVESALAVFGQDIDWHQNGHCNALPAGLPLGGPAVAGGRLRVGAGRGLVAGSRGRVGERGGRGAGGRLW